MSSHPTAAEQPPKVSAVVNTLNAGETLALALQSLVGWVDEIVVVDMHSDDDTVDIARSFGATVFTHARAGYVEPARAYAVAQAQHPWIMVIDADELVPRSLAERLLLVAATGDYDVVMIPWANYVFGDVPRAGVLSPANDAHPRFFRRDAVVIDGRMHSMLDDSPSARVLALPADERLCVTHLSHPDASAFLEKLNRYTTVEAREAAEASGAAARGGPMRAAAREFARGYVKHRGYRDGWRGYQLALLMAMYRGVSKLKLLEQANGGGVDAADVAHQRAAREIFAEWDTNPIRADHQPITAPGGHPGDVH